MWLWIMIALLIPSVGANCFFFITWRPMWLTRALWRESYTRGFKAGQRRQDAWHWRRRQIELHDANRRTGARPDAGPAAHVSKVRFQSGP